MEHELWYVSVAYLAVGRQGINRFHLVLMELQKHSYKLMCLYFSTGEACRVTFPYMISLSMHSQSDPAIYLCASSSFLEKPKWLSRELQSLSLVATKIVVFTWSMYIIDCMCRHLMKYFVQLLQVATVVKVDFHWDVIFWKKLACDTFTWLINSSCDCGMCHCGNSHPMKAAGKL